MITFSVDRARHVRVATFVGLVDDAELHAAYASLLADPAFDPTLDDLVDLRGVARLEVSAIALREVIAMFTPVDAIGAPTRLAFVAASDVTFGMSRMYELLRGDDVPEEIRVFRDYGEAIGWLTGGR